MNLAQPPPILSPYVKQYWGIEGTSCVSTDYSIKIVPTGLVELDFYLGSIPGITQSDRNISENSVLNGQQKQHYDIHITDKLLMFSVIFQPAGAMLFFDMPMQEIYNQNVSLKHFIKAPVDKLEEQLYCADNFLQRTEIMNHFLFELLKKNYKEFEHSRINDSIRLINSAKGKISIEELASQACLSRKQFERVFTNSIGSTPKQFLRTVRFQYVLFNRSYLKNQSLTELAYKSGYYDQSHMIADFKYLTGLTPKQYFNGCESVSDYFA